MLLFPSELIDLGLEMETSIKDELYSDILDKSNLQPSLKLTTDSRKNDSPASDWDDLWYDGEPCHDSTEKLDKADEMDREWQRRHDQFHTIGYRDGLLAGKEASAQEGFNVGFKESVYAGFNWGLVRGVTGALACLPDELKQRMFDNNKEIQNKFHHLHESVQSLSTTEVLKVFHDYLQKKSASGDIDESNSCTTVSNDRNSDGSLLEDYQKELQSLILESGLKFHLDTEQ